MSNVAMPKPGILADALPAHFVDEESFGVEPIQALLNELNETEDEWASEGALFDQGGLYDDFRKAMLDMTALEIRTMMQKNGVKTTEADIMQQAHSDKAYTAFLDDMKKRKTDWILLNTARKKVEMRFNRGQALLRIAARSGG